jgi:transketolase
VVIAQPGLNVKVVGAYAGLLTGKTGKTHQIFNDVALMRTLSGVVVLAPGDEEETRQATKAMLELNGPVYMQTTRDPSPALFDSDYHFEIGRAVVLREGTDVTLVSTGPQSARAREAAEILSRQGVSAAVLHLPTIKPIDEDALVRAAQTTGLVVVVEEQNVLGGLGGAVAEVLSDRCPVPVKRLGILDTYGESGSNDVLLDKYRLSAAAVASDVLSIVDTSRELAVAGQQ